MSLEVVVFKKCYKEGNTNVRSNQIYTGVPDKWEEGCDKLLNVIRKLFLAGQTEGVLPTDDPEITMSWEVNPYLSGSELFAKGQRLMVS